MLHRQGAQEQLIGLVYDSVLEPEKWQDFLQLLCEETEAAAANFPVLVRGDELRVPTISRGISPQVLQTWQRPEIRNPWAKSLTRTGVICLSHHFCPDHELVQTEFYRQILAPANLFYGAGIVILLTREVASLLTVWRPRSAGPFDADAAQLLDALLPHLNRAARMQALVNDAYTGASVAFSALDAVSAGMVIVDGAGQVLDRSKAAAELMKAGPLMMVAGRLRAENPADSRRLSSAMADAARAAETGGVFPAVSLLLRRNLGQPPVVAMVSAVRPAKPHPFIAPTARAVLVIRDLGVQNQPSLGVLRDLFSFTPAECDIALALHRGQALPEIAAMRNTVVETIRTQIKRMLQKTGTRRQAELVALLGRLSWEPEASPALR